MFVWHPVVKTSDWCLPICRGGNPTIQTTSRPHGSGKSKKARCCFQRRARKASKIVGLAGFEPTTSCTPSKRASQAALQPDVFSKAHLNIIFMMPAGFGDSWVIAAGGEFCKSGGGLPDCQA